MESAAMDSPSTFRRIGKGFCGTVWTADLSNEECAIKCENIGPRKLHNDYIMHQHILDSIPATIGPRICVPKCQEFITCDNQGWWNTQLPRFPKQTQMPCNALVTERIQPFPKTTRENIIDFYCPKPKQDLIKASIKDQDCLIRPYLGRRRHIAQRSISHGFSLRNYCLNLDQIEELGLNKNLYAEIMAETLATLYWRAHIDANNVEFVLAPPRKDGMVHSQRIMGDSKPCVLGDHAMWILDFDSCRQMEMNGEGVEQAVMAFCKNDPFYPRPGYESKEDQELWNIFKNRFLHASEEILGEGSANEDLHVIWVEMVEEVLWKQRNSSTGHSGGCTVGDETPLLTRYGYISEVREGAVSRFSVGVLLYTICLLGIYILVKP